MLSAEAISQAVLSSPTRLLPTGALTKAALATGSDGAQRLDMRPLRGIVCYEPSEFLITALAGTPVSELQAVLQEQGQYLPYDPLFVSGGSTIGGSIASGISGPNRLLYGGLRDFVMEVEFVDGLGKLVRGGGKVVKNAAGFDLPKLMVGSYGRLGILTEVTLKVFPQPQAYATLTAESTDLPSGMATVQRLLSKPLPVTALEMNVQGKIYARFAGPAGALGNVLARAVEVIGSPCETIDALPAEQQFWQQRAAWFESDAEDGRQLIRIATTLESLAEFIPCLPQLESIDARLSCAGSVVWVTLEPADYSKLEAVLEQHGLSAVVITGATGQFCALGDRRWVSVARRIQQALDPQGKWVPF